MGWEKLSTKVVYENRWIRVVEDKVINPSGEKSIYAYLDTKSDSVFIVPVTDEGEIVLIKVYRYLTNIWSWELPGGNSDGEEFLEAAKRELLEETGMVAKNWKEVGYFIALNGVVGERTHVFLARDLEKSKGEKMAEEGISDVKKVSFKKALEMIRKDELTDAQSIVALFRVKLFLGI